MCKPSASRSKFGVIAALGFVLALGAVPSGTGFAPTAAIAASKIVATVDKRAITNNDVRRRAALLRLQRKRGNLNSQARKELVEEALKLNEADRRNVRVPDSRVNDAFAGFARSNNLTQRQLTQVLNRAGVGTRGFKDFIRAQIAWNALVRSRLGSTGAGGRPRNINEALFQTAERARTNEYVLQQVVFFNSNRSSSKSIAEAKTMRAGFTNCEATLGQAAPYQNVVVRSLGRIQEERLPADWKKFIVGTAEGGVTAVRKTERGAEYIAVCRKASLGKEGGSKPGFDLGVEGGAAAEEVSSKYLAELRERAVIR
ncbi:MAG: SurA N-terminal domain-containing protein [Pseudomonadota bacterium]